MHPTPPKRASHVCCVGARVKPGVRCLPVKATMTSRQRKKDKSGYGGSWKESPFEKLDLPFTVESLKTVLASGADEGSPSTHQQIADWCFSFWWEREEGSLSSLDDERLDAAAEVAIGVDAQWDLYLADEFTLGELQTMDFSKVRMPEEWFDNWQKELASHAS